MSYEHFARQEEEISNKYMSANGDSDKYSNQTGFSKGIGQALRFGIAIVGVGSYLAYKKYGGKGVLYLLGGLVAFYKIDKKYKILNRK